MPGQRYSLDADSSLAVSLAGVLAHDRSCQESNGDEGDGETHVVVLVVRKEE